MNQPIKPLVNDLVRCPATARISEAAQLMTRKKRNIIFVTQEELVIGVVNSNDLKKRVVAAGIDPSRPVMEVMTSPVQTIYEKVLLYEALLTLKSRNVSHLATIDSKGNISGVIGYENIMEMYQNAISFLIREIEIAEDVNQLAQIYKRVPVLVKALLQSGDRTENVNRIITSVADAMHRRVVGFAIEEMGHPPCRFAFMVMGSEGRGEQTLATDQDNAIVYENVGGHVTGISEGSGERADEKSGTESGKGSGEIVGRAEGMKTDETFSDEIRSYFLELGERVNRYLHTIGYRYCKGNVMAGNPKWSQPVEQWKQYFTQWINNSNPQDVLEVAIFFDFRYIYGDQQLVKQLRDHVHIASANKSVFFYHMAQSVLKFKPPLNVFGRIVGRDSVGDALEVDIKKAMMPVLAFIRLYAIRENLLATNSMERLNALAELKILDSTSYEEMVQAYELMMHLRLKFQVESISQNEEPGNTIDLNRLTRMEAAMLKKTFSQITDLQTKVGFDFKG